MLFFPKKVIFHESSEYLDAKATRKEREKVSISFAVVGYTINLSFSLSKQVM